MKSRPRKAHYLFQADDGTMYDITLHVHTFRPEPEPEPEPESTFAADPLSFPVALCGGLPPQER